MGNRRLYALQSAAVERWPARCLVRVLVATGHDSAQALPDLELRKLQAPGPGPQGQHQGKPKALMEHCCGDVEVLLSSRASSWHLWNSSAAVLQRCGLDITAETLDKFQEHRG